MAPWTFLKINYVPMSLGVVFSLGLITCFVIAVTRDDVSPYVPFISETGGLYPEAGIFSIFLYLSGTVGLATLFVRYLIVDELNKGIDKAIDILNKASIIIGFIAMMGMIVVAAYPMTTIITAHEIGADVLFIGCNIYAIIHTIISYRMSGHYIGRTICHIRLSITILSILALITMLTTGPLAISLWNSGEHKHWTGGKTPEDKGFGLLVASAVAEWMMAAMFVAYYFTFIREFGKVAAHVRVQVLVEHFDDDVEEINVATENTPIVM